MAHEYAKEAKASHDKKLKSYGANTSSTADKLDDKDDATNWAGFRALNTNKQAGMAPLNKKASMSEETNPRIMRKKGGRVHGAESLKRLDKAGRKSKAAGGVPSPGLQQEAFDKTTRTKPGEMPQGITRAKGGKIQNFAARSHESQAAQGKRPWEGHKKGGRIAKRDGGSFLDDLGNLGHELGNIFLGEDEAPAAAAPAARRAAPARHRAVPTIKERIHEIEHPAHSADIPLPPRRPLEFTEPRGIMAAPQPGMPNEGGMREFLKTQGVGAAPTPTSSDSSTADPFFARELYNRKDGGRLVRKSGGKAFEGSAKDEREDKKLEKKYGMSHKEWEASDLDKKHDRQESMKGLRSGGRAKRAAGGGAFDDYMGGSSEGSSRKGSSGKGKTTVNIMIGAQPQPSMATPQSAGAGIDPALLEAIMGGAGGPPQQLPPPAPPGGAPGGAPMPMPAPAMAAPPPPPPGPGAGGPPMMRKDGGKVQVKYKNPGRSGDYPKMDFGSGGGFGRKQKIAAYGDTQKK